MELAMTLGYLLVKFREDPCRDKIYPGQNVQNLLQAVALASLNILKKFLFWQIWDIYTYKTYSYRFFPYPTQESEN